jgi:acyl-CoA synthetase (NDP forming)
LDRIRLQNMALNDIFYPRSIAVVGASSEPFNFNTQMFLDALIDFGYKGEIYPINPKFDQVSGLKSYQNILHVPGVVDNVTCLIPAATTPQLLRDCVAKKVKVVQLFTAGFAETGEDEGRRLQAELVNIARSGGVRIIGPNCVGIYCPKSGISHCPDFPKEPGKVSFITQSGSYTYLLVRMAAPRGVRFSKVVSYGNASDINEIDLLDYLAHDPETEIICAYIEGTRDGQQLLRVLTEAAARKPVIIVKKGCTEAGSRGARSHTGALAGDDAVWEGAIKQAGALRVEDVEEMVDMLVTFLFLPLPQSKKTVVVGAGGGVSVRASDECEAGGLILPRIPEGLRVELKRFIPLAGSMLRNPVDVLAESYGNAWTPILRALDSWEETDILLWQICPEIEPFRESSFRQLIIEVRRSMLETFKNLRKPKAVVVHAVESHAGLEELDAIRAMCQEHKLAFYPSLYRAARAISRYMDHHKWLNRQA